MSSPPRPGSGHPVPDSEFEIPVDLVILALGFEKADLGIMMGEGSPEPDFEGSAAEPVNGVFAAGDLALSSSLVARAIASGRSVASQAERFLSRL